MSRSHQLQAAKLKLQQLEELEAAEDALEDAQHAQPRSAERLRRALQDAEAAGLSEDGKYMKIREAHGSAKNTKKKTKDIKRCQTLKHA